MYLVYDLVEVLSVHGLGVFGATLPPLLDRHVNVTLLEGLGELFAVANESELQLLTNLFHYVVTAAIATADTLGDAFGGEAVVVLEDFTNITPQFLDDLTSLLHDGVPIPDLYWIIWQRIIRRPKIIIPVTIIGWKVSIVILLIRLLELFLRSVRAIHLLLQRALIITRTAHIETVSVARSPAPTPGTTPSHGWRLMRTQSITIVVLIEIAGVEGGCAG